jgi:hypothetical protein
MSFAPRAAFFIQFWVHAREKIEGEATSTRCDAFLARSSLSIRHEVHVKVIVEKVEKTRHALSLIKNPEVCPT